MFDRTTVKSAIMFDRTTIKSAIMFDRTTIKSAVINVMNVKHRQYIMSFIFRSIINVYRSILEPSFYIP